jgi:hypothetical protein
MSEWMYRSYRHFLILWGAIVFPMSCLASCGEQSDQAERAQKTVQSEQAQEPHCKQIASLFAMDSWESLASGPFKTNKTNDITEISAPQEV